MNKQCTITRDTKETQISLSLSLYGSGKTEVQTGCGFFDHMLTLLAFFARFDLQVRAQGDLDVDAHHTVEDVGIVLGQAFAQALGEVSGVQRYGSIALPMDEALVLAAVDLSGRGMACCALDGLNERIGTFETELYEEFFTAFCRHARLTLHLQKLAGRNTHHILEAAFKGVGRALRMALAPDAAANGVPSSKGVL